MTSLPKAGLAEYRFRIAQLLSNLGLGLGLLVIVPNLRSELASGHPITAWVELGAVLILGLNALLGRRRPWIRSHLLIAVVFCLGGYFFADRGIYGSGQTWLGASVVFAAVLFGEEGAIALSSATALVFLAIAALVSDGYLAGLGSRVQIELAGMNVVLLSLTASLAGAQLVTYLREEISARDSLHAALRDRESALEEESAERREAEALAAFYRDFDGLTHLPNRGKFLRDLGSALRQANRRDRGFAVLAIGLDRHGRIIDSLGHSTADTLLIQAAGALRAGFRDDDIVARIGDDLFAILCSDLRRPEDVMGLIEKSKTIFSKPFDRGVAKLRLSASVGVALYPNDGADSEELLRAAESALRSSRDGGRDSFRLFDAGIQQAFVDRLRLEEELEAALRMGSIEPWFQPKVDSRGRIIGAEALARWILPDGQVLLPSSFIAIAEGSGDIVELGRAMLAATCDRAASWQRAGRPPLRISVNLSPFQFKSPFLVNDVRSALEDSGLDPRHLELEITESGIMAVEEEAAERLAELKGLGVALSIDDFGTGSSSIAKLRDYPVDAVKVPKSFVDPLPGDYRASMIVRAVIELAHNLEFSVIAEGVEDRAQFDWLKAVSCDQYQGYLFAPALRSADFEIALAKGFSAIVQ